MTIERSTFTFGLIIDPVDPDAEVSEADFRNTLTDLRDFLANIETEIAGGTPQLHWAWDADPAIRLRAEVNGVSAATIDAIVSTGRSGFAAVREPDGRVGTILPDSARRKLVTLVNRLTRFASITITADDQPPVVIEAEQQAPAAVGARVLAEYSEIDGTLDVINVHGSPHFVIFEQLTGRRVRCALPDSLLVQVKDALKTRVLVEGLVRYRADGTPVSIREITNFRILPEPESNILDFEGRLPGLTGDLPSGEFIRQQREENG
ncbi:MAG: hypothetical protein WC273_07905 [Dehalococcoidia bacterium]